jgi:rod shape-determining protein MreC
VLLLIVLTAVTLITLDTRSGRTGPIGAAGRLAHRIVTPIEGAVSSAARPIGDWWSGVIHAGHLKSQNRALRNEVAQLKGEQAQAQQAIRENAILEQICGLPLFANTPKEVARIVGRDEGNFDPTLTINKGTEDHIAKNQAVIAPDGSVVGKVIEASVKFAKIRVLTDPDSAIGVQSLAHPPSHASTGTAIGQEGSHELLAIDFDPDSKILIGDPIVTSSLSPDFPADLRVGSVSKVTPDPGGGIVRVHIDPYVDLGALDYVVVLNWAQGEPGVVSTTTSTTSTSTTTTPSSSSTTTTLPSASATSSTLPSGSC